MLKVTYSTLLNGTKRGNPGWGLNSCAALRLWKSHWLGTLTATQLQMTPTAAQSCASFLMACTTALLEPASQFLLACTFAKALTAGLEPEHAY